MTADPITSPSSATGAIAQNTSPDTARGSGTVSVQAMATHAAFDLPAIASPETQEPARLIAGPPLPEFLARGLVIIQYRAEDLRVVPVFGSAALEVKPRIGDVHVVIHNYRWRIGLAQSKRQYEALEKRRADAPIVRVPTITLEGDANGAPHPAARARCDEAHIVTGLRTVE